MQKYTFERWLCAASVVLVGLMMLPETANAQGFDPVSLITIHPVKIGSALLLCFLGIKLFPANRQHF